MKKEPNFWTTVAIVTMLVSVLWIVQFSQYFGIYDFHRFGNHPGNRSGLWGILFSPFIHGSFEHLISNTLPIMVLLTVLLNAYPRLAIPVLIVIHLLSGALVWLLAPPNGIHIGISGIIYGIAGFLVASGIFRKNRASTVIAMLVVMVYGGMIEGFFPKQGVSWESHLYGALSGVIMAYLLRNTDLPLEVSDEEPPDEGHFFDPKPPIVN